MPRRRGPGRSPSTLGTRRGRRTAGPAGSAPPRAAVHDAAADRRREAFVGEAAAGAARRAAPGISAAPTVAAAARNRTGRGSPLTDHKPRARPT